MESFAFVIDRFIPLPLSQNLRRLCNWTTPARIVPLANASKFYKPA